MGHKDPKWNSNKGGCFPSGRIKSVWLKQNAVIKKGNIFIVHRVIKTWEEFKSLKSFEKYVQIYKLVSTFPSNR